MRAAFCTRGTDLCLNIVYDIKKYWPKESLERRKRMVAKAKADQGKTETKGQIVAEKDKEKEKGLAALELALDETTRGTEDIKLGKL